MESTNLSRQELEVETLIYKITNMSELQLRDTLIRIARRNIIPSTLHEIIDDAKFK